MTLVTDYIYVIDCNRYVEKSMTTGTEVTMLRCRNGEKSMILRDRRDSLLMGPNLEFDRRDTLVYAGRIKPRQGIFIHIPTVQFTSTVVQPHCTVICRLHDIVYALCTVLNTVYSGLHWYTNFGVLFSARYQHAVQFCCTPQINIIFYYDVVHTSEGESNK